ncbi:MAG: putative membrane protein YfcA [Polaribacter sp.]|jgi:uncharacterized membrane protein YfcA
MMTDPYSLTFIAFTFLLAGSVKGTIGLGLPVISLGLLVASFDLTTAMVLVIIPAFVTNVWQAIIGGHGIVILKRLWLFLSFAIATIWMGAIALSTINTLYLSILLGVLLLSYSSLNFIGLQFSIQPRQEKWIGSLMGAANGIFTGMTGSLSMPGVLYLQAIGLSRDMLVQAMGILFLLSTISLALALQNKHLLSSELTTISAFSVIPSLIGMAIGQRIRKQLSEQIFRRVVSIAIFLLGTFIILKACLSMY